jgi:hypothetical protein
MRGRACPVNTEHGSTPCSRAGVTAEVGGNVLGREGKHVRREERREAGSGGGAVTRYQMRQRMISIGDDYRARSTVGAGCALLPRMLPRP